LLSDFSFALRSKKENGRENSLPFHEEVPQHLSPTNLFQPCRTAPHAERLEVVVF